MGSENIVKRRQGRPVGETGGVGREMLIEAAIRLLREHAPARITISSIAREAGADPALVRYYFGNRTALLIEIVDRLTKNRSPDFAEGRAIEALGSHIHNTFGFTRSARYMHRLMLDELSDAGNDAGRYKLRDLNLDLIDGYRRLKTREGHEEMVDFDPLFLNLAVLAVSDFFHSATALIEELAPPGTDMTTLTAEYEDFIVKLFTEGLRKR